MSFKKRFAYALRVTNQTIRQTLSRSTLWQSYGHPLVPNWRAGMLFSDGPARYVSQNTGRTCRTARWQLLCMAPKWVTKHHEGSRAGGLAGVAAGARGRGAGGGVGGRTPPSPACVQRQAARQSSAQSTSCPLCPQLNKKLVIFFTQQQKDASAA